MVGVSTAGVSCIGCDDFGVSALLNVNGGGVGGNGYVSGVVSGEISDVAFVDAEPVAITVASCFWTDGNFFFWSNQS